jgi:hypothetical protein
MIWITLLPFLPLCRSATYVRDPDGHLLEYLAMLDSAPRSRKTDPGLVRVGPQSTEMAERLYASVGFRDLGLILEYAPPPKR